MVKFDKRDLIFSRLFRRFDSTLQITMLGMLAAVAMVAKFISIDLGAIKLSFFYIPCFLAGAFFGPVGGLTVGFVGEMIGSFLKYGSPMPWILVGNSLMGLIIGLVFLIPKLNSFFKFGIGTFAVFIIVTWGFNSLAQWQATAEKVNYFTYLITARIWQPLVLVINVALVIPIYEALRIYFNRKYPE